MIEQCQPGMLARAATRSRVFEDGDGAAASSSDVARKSQRAPAAITITRTSSGWNLTLGALV